MPSKLRHRRRRLAGKVRLWWLGAGLAAAALVAIIQARARPEPDRQPAGAAVYDYKIVKVYPHDPQAFTQGLIYRDGFLYESTGLNGRSTLRKVRLETGEVLQQHTLDARYFAEGLTDWGNRLVQLTWRSNVGFVYDLSSLAMQETFTYTGEGWGLTRDRERLIMSDGSASLRFLDPTTFRETGRITVRDGDQSVEHLNELEVVRDEIYANVWQTERIGRIDPRSGTLTGWVDLYGLLRVEDRTAPVDVLNGIAYDPHGDRLFVTGKLWPRLFEIKLQRRQ